MDKVALQVDHLTVSLGSRVVLEDVSLVVEQGDFLGLIGPNGAGKTVLLKTILGLVTPDSGRVVLLGDTPEKSRLKVGYVPQLAGFDRSFPIRALDVVLMGMLAQRGAFARPNSVERDKAQHALEQVGLGFASKRQIGKLSGGELQRVLIARAIAKEPEMMLLDEPTASLDTRVGSDLYALLTELAGSKTIILVSHDIGVISAHVTTIACLNRTLHCHTKSELTAEILSETYGCPVELLAHGVPHRVLASHQHGDCKHEP